MSLLKASLDSAPSVAVPFRVRLDPYLVESICELARLVRDKGASNNDISGLLFGRVETGVRVAQALKTFVDMGTHSELARRQRWDKAYRSTADEAKKDPELSQLEVVGWFSFRAGSGLLSSDVVFHNQHFRKAEDVALIIWREGPSQITVEVYSTSDQDTMTADNYRWGSVRLSADIRHMREPVELALRLKLADDTYLRAYHNNDSVSHLEGLKRRAEETSRRLFGFLHKDKEEIPMEDVKGLLGDGRMPGRTRPAMDGTEPPISPQTYFNPYSDHIVGRSRMPAPEARSNEAATNGPAGAPPPVATPANGPGNGLGYGTAPARAPEYRSDFAFTPPVGQAAQHQVGPGPGTELMQIGRSPFSGRTPQNEVGGLPMLLRPPTPPRRPSVWPWALGVCLLCSALVFGFLALGGLQGENGRLSQIVASAFPGNALNLRVRNEDDRLRLSWNQQNHFVASANDATLQIFDGPGSREIHLDGRQVADGSVLYRPQTNDITFRLEVHGDQGSTAGSVRVLDGLSSRQSTLDVSAPAQSLASNSLPNPATTTDPTTSPSLLPEETKSASGSAPAGAATASSAPLIASTPSNTPSTPAVLRQPMPASGALGSAPAAIRSFPPATSNRNRTPRYETPETIRPIRPESMAPAPATETPSTLGTSSTGTTINGWDSVPAWRQRNRSGFVAARPASQVTPNVGNLPAGTIPRKTRVAVQVAIDASGHVTSARPLTAAVSGTLLGSALSAARQWTFNPAQSNGRAVSSYHTIVFEFPAH